MMDYLILGPMYVELDGRIFEHLEVVICCHKLYL